VSVKKRIKEQRRIENRNNSEEDEAPCEAVDINRLVALKLRELQRVKNQTAEGCNVPWAQKAETD
jgi:hypothetical protein